MIRKAKMEDCADLARLADVLGYSSTLKETSDRLKTVLADERHILFVAEENTKLLGYIEGAETYSLILSRALRIMGIAVDIDYQNQGIGGQLIEALERAAREKAYGSILLTSGESRYFAHDFYEKHGYVLDHLQKKFTKSL